jgi:dipeptidyl aminopeptidase/acylaminoacyl peptidase
MKTNIQFICEEQIIQGRFFSASATASRSPTLLLLPGFPGSDDDVLGLGEAFSRQGLNVLTFNYRGTFQSEGRFSLEGTHVDIQAAFDFLQDEETVDKHGVDPTKLVLGGWSYGGGMGLIYAANHPEVAHVFSVAGTDHGAFAREYQRNESFASQIDAMFDGLRYPNGPVRFARKLAVSDGLVPNQALYDLLGHAEKLAARDVLLMGGWDDQNVTIERHILPCYRRLKDLGSDKVRIHAFQADHYFENSRSEMVAVVTEWIEALFGRQRVDERVS